VAKLLVSPQENQQGQPDVTQPRGGQKTGILLGTCTSNKCPDYFVHREQASIGVELTSRAEKIIMTGYNYDHDLCLLVVIRFLLHRFNTIKIIIIY